jgi:hypothetical protein
MWANRGFPPPPETARDIQIQNFPLILTTTHSHDNTKQRPKKGNANRTIAGNLKKRTTLE